MKKYYLNDIPSDDDIRSKARIICNDNYQIPKIAGFIKGANYIISLLKEEESKSTLLKEGSDNQPK